MKTHFLVVFAAFITTVAFGQTFTVGSGNALDFASNIGSANHIDLGGLTAINNANFTFECWMKVNSVTDDPAFFSNKNWASGSNIGLAFDVQDNGTNMKFNFKDATNPRKDLTVAVNEHLRDWFHLAGTFNKTGYFKVYINGVSKDSVNVSSLTGSFLSTYTYKLGQDGTGNYTYSGTNPRYNGKMDEVRIWTTVRTQQEIRDNMCRKLTGTEPNLYAYYNCDLASGVSLTDLTSSVNTGTLVNTISSIWSPSGAPIGNTSTNMYATSFGTSTLQISNPTYGDVTVKNISNTAGIHLYRVTALPNYTLGLNNLASNNNYYGVFVTDTNYAVSYNVEYDYTNFTTAISDEPNLKLFNRVKNDGMFWSDNFAIQNTTSNTLTKSFLNKRKEFILGTKAGVSCNAPSNINLVGNTATSASIGWTTGGSSNWNVQWGLPGFSLGTGNKILNASSNPITLSSPSSATYYDMYVQDTCLGSGKSYWVGPFTFSTGPLPSMVTNTLPVTGSNTVACGTNTKLYDNGGASANYAANCNGFTVLNNSGNGIINISGIYSYIETGWDYLKIYSGAGTSGTLLYTYSNNGGGTITPFSSLPGQIITVLFTSDGSAQGGGFDMNVIYSVPTITVSGTPAICAGSSVTLTASGASTYSWTGLGSTNPLTVSPTASTVYSVSASNCGITNTTLYSISVSPIPTVAAFASNTLICLGGSALLTASTSAASYTWNTGATSMTTSVSPTITTTYTVNVACSASAIVTVNVSTCTGIDELISNAIGVYPNPNNGILNVSIPFNLAKKSTLEIYDAIGKLIVVKQLSDELNTIDISVLSNGIYIFKILNDESLIKFGKLVRQ